MLNLFRSLSGRDMLKGKDAIRGVLDTLVSFLSEDCSPGSESLILLQKDDSASGLSTLEARIQFTVGALRMHPDNVSVQSAGCKCLSNFAITTEVVAQLIQAEALPLVLEALKRFWFEADLQRAACSALWNIARNNDARTILGVTAAEAIFRTLELHKGSDFVQEAALGSLANLSPCADVQNFLCGEEKLHAIFLSMYTHRECDLLQTAACGLLNNLAHGDTHALTIGQMGGIRLIVNAMRTHCHNGKLLRNACAALANLSTEQKNFKKLLRAKALESLFFAYHCFEEEVPSLKEMARAALTNMGVRDLAFKTSSMHLAALNARGSLDAIVPMMEGKHTALYGDRRSFTFEENEDINCTDSELNTPLHLAIERRDATLTRTLVAQGGDLRLKNKYDQSPIELADVLCTEDAKREAEDFEGKYENGQDVDESATAEQVKAAIVEGRRRHKITKSIFRDMVCQFLPDVPSDVAGLLSEFVDIANFLLHVEVDTAFDQADATWRNFRKFLKQESYTLATPRCSDVSIASNGFGGLPLPLSMAALGATVAHRGSISSGAVTLGALGGPPEASSSSPPGSGFRVYQPPSLIIPGAVGGVPPPTIEATPQQSALTRLHCRRVSHSYPGMEGLYRAAFGDGVVPDDVECESKDAAAPNVSPPLVHVPTPFAGSNRPDDRRRHGGKRPNGALWPQGTAPSSSSSVNGTVSGFNNGGAAGVRRDSDVAMLDSIDEVSAFDDDAEGAWIEEEGLDGVVDPATTRNSSIRFRALPVQTGERLRGLRTRAQPSSLINRAGTSVKQRHEREEKQQWHATQALATHVDPDPISRRQPPHPRAHSSRMAYGRCRCVDDVEGGIYLNGVLFRAYGMWRFDRWVFSALLCWLLLWRVVDGCCCVGCCCVGCCCGGLLWLPSFSVFLFEFCVFFSCCDFLFHVFRLCCFHVVISMNMHKVCNVSHVQQ